MGNYEMCNNMDKYLYNFYQQNTAGLNPTYCAASMSGGSLGGICIPEGCQGVGGANFTFTEFRELVVEILKSDGEISTDCQRYAVGDRISLIPSIVTDCNYIHCANEYSKNDYLTKLFHWAEMFDPQGMFQSYYIPTTVECYPTKPEYDTKTTVFIVFIFALLGVVFLSTIWSLLGRTKVREVFGGSSAKKEGRGLLDEPLLNPAEIRTTAEGFEEDEEVRWSEERGARGEKRGMKSEGCNISYPNDPIPFAIHFSRRRRPRSSPLPRWWSLRSVSLPTSARYSRSRGGLGPSRALTA